MTNEVKTYREIAEEVQRAYNELEQEYADLTAECDDASDRYEAARTEADSLTQVNATLADEYGRLLAQLKWTHGILAILIEEQGGIIEMDKQLLLTYDLPSASINAYEDEENERFIITVSITEDEDDV